MLFCKEWYLNNAGTAGTVVADAHFITDKTGYSQRRVWGGTDYGFPDIKCISAVEALAAGAKLRLGYGTLTGLGGGYDANYDRYSFIIPQWSNILPSVTANDDAGVNPTQYERYDEQQLWMPYPDGMTLCDGTVSKIFASLASSYSAFVLYQQAGSTAPPPRGGRVSVVKYDKGSDLTTVVWNVMENAAQNAAGELRKDRMYRLLWGSFDAQALTDTEALMARVTVDGYPPLIFCGAGSYYHPQGARRIMFLDDSIVMRGDAVHKVEGHIGAASQPTVNLGWEDIGPAK